MLNANGFEFNMEAADSSKMSVGDHVVQEGYEAKEKPSALDLIQENERTIKQYTEQLSNHFSTVLGGLPEAVQKSFVDSLRGLGSNSDNVVYAAFVAKYDARVSSQASV